MSQISKKSSKQSLLCCRACLSTDCRLYDIHEYKADDAFARITDTQVSRGLLPQHLCAWCLTLLRKCASFRAMCVRTQQRLTEIIEWRMNTGGTRRPYPRPFDLTRTEVILIDCVPPDYMMYAPDVMGDVTNADSEIENENESTFDLKNNLKVNSKTQIGTSVKENDDNFNTHDDDDKLDEDVLTDIVIDEKETNDAEVNISVDNCEYPKTQKSSEVMKMLTIKAKNKVDFKKDNETYDVLKDNVCGRQVKSAKRRRPRTKRSSKHLRHPTDGYILFDFASFESVYAVKVVALSKEEQLQEMASRKKSRNYVESPFKCEECGRGFLAEKPYTNHRARQHDPSKKHPCEICGLRFKMNCRRQQHQDGHRLKFQCNECNFVARYKDQAKAHHAMHAGKRFLCQHCGKSFTKMSTYLSHLRLAHPGHNVACGECGETFVSDLGLRNHMKHTHAQSLKPQYKCSTCSANFASVEALNRHTDTAGDHADLRPCEQCGENCASEAELHQHVREKHPTESHHCEECDTTFSSSAAYETHHRRKHLGERYRSPYVQLLRRRQRRPYTTPCVCDQCGHIAKSRTLLEYHMRSHLAVKPFPCPHCPKTCVTQNLLNYHLSTHTGEKPFQCADCGLGFGRKHYLSRHQQTVHMGLRGRFPCAICARAYTTKGMLQLHVRTTHGGMPWPKRTRNKATARVTSSTSIHHEGDAAAACQDHARGHAVAQADTEQGHGESN